MFRSVTRGTERAEAGRKPPHEAPAAHHNPVASRRHGEIHAVAADPRAIASLQRLAGNAAVAQAMGLRRPSVQREGDAAATAIHTAQRQAGEGLVTHAVSMLEAAKAMVDSAIPLGHSPQTMGGAIPLLASAGGQVQSADHMLAEGLALQGRIVRGAHPGASIGRDGMPMDEGGWLGVRLQLMTMGAQISAASPATAQTISASLQKLLLDCRGVIADDHVRAARAQAG